MPDLDRAFEALANDISRRPGAPGASAAISSARRRRGTTIVSAVAAAAVIVGGVAVAPRLLDAGEREVQVAAGERAVPAPDALSAQVLTTATEGWLPPTKKLTGSQAEIELISRVGAPVCLEAIGPDPSPSSQPTRSGSQWFAAGDSPIMVGSADFGDRAGAAAASRAELSASLDCGVASEPVTYAGGATVDHWRIEGDGHVSGDVWLAQLDARLVMLMVNDTGASADAEVVERVSAALVASAQVDETFTNQFLGEATESSSHSESDVATASPDPSTTDTLGTSVDLKAAESAMGSWLDDAVLKGAEPNLPCLPEGWTVWSHSSSGGSGSGAKLTFSWAEFADGDPAKTYDELAGNLNGCESVTVTPLPDLSEGRAMLVHYVADGTPITTWVVTDDAKRVTTVTAVGPQAPAPELATKVAAAILP